ncbi:DUF3472 domain-containing protein [Luteolibacter arcticus]|uniref:DUF3472 domain-containing protein n=1 Tax=Luteolibacter arcticus TaxID=1581411 RepID=A0ABT3GLL4_9BACT|nr:DUF3472 domain-containing protein [Luteolibacter arcticus]MCW1924377.1 DUF3472 domain-containing protein [Luteolibacter arcticus]
MAVVEVPAFTSFSSPEPNKGADRGRDGEITRWEEKTKLHWYGQIAAKGSLDLSLNLAGELPAGARLKLTVSAQDGSSKGRAVEGKATGELVAFGKVEVSAPGYYRFELEGKGDRLPALKALVLDGPASEGAHFSMVERRNAASIHLGYPVPDEAKEEVEWFYLEVTPKTDPLWSYYMATGWHRGYFGMQVNDPGERRIIFSVWDAGNEAVSRDKVHDEHQVKLLAKGDGVHAGGFGNEGTGGHSHLVYPWKLGDTVHFLMRAQAEGDKTTYTGWFRKSKETQWHLVASFQAPKDGKFLHGLYSFNENFIGSNGDERRVCEFGNGWIRTKSGKWIPLTEARFTHDGHGKSERLDRSAGTIGKRFYLANGGFVEDTNKGAVTKAYDAMKIPAAEGKAPTEAELEKLPMK